jgi:predicted Zn finger-like uncharacterized protein
LLRDAVENAMHITCPNCATSYNLDESAVGNGRPVRCARCQVTWFAEPARQQLVLAGERQDFWGEPENEERRALEADRTPATALVTISHDVAEYQIEAPPLAPAAALPGHDMPTIDVEPSQDIETIAARNARTRSARRASDRKPIPVAALIILGCGAALAALAQWRAEVVRIAPQTASLYAAIGLDVNVRGLTFRNVRSSSEMHEGMPVLVVEGDIVNVAKTAVDVPRMRFAVRNDSGLEVYAWTAQPAQATLPLGAAAPFRTRLASPPGDAHDVFVRFFNRRDLAEAGRS